MMVNHIKYKKFFVFIFVIGTSALFSQQAKLDSLSKQIDKLPDNIKGRIYLKLGEVYSKLNIQKSNFYLNQALAKTSKKDSITLSKIYHRIHSNYHKQESLDSAKYFFDIYYKYLPKIIKPKKLHIFMAVYGDYYLYKEKFDSAYYYLKKAYTISLQLKDSATFIGVLNNLAIFYGTKGDIDSSLSVLKKSVEISEKQNISYMKEILYCNISYSYIRMHKLDSATLYSQKAFEVATQKKDSEMVCNILLNFSQIDYELQNYISAEEKLQTALKYYKTHTFFDKHIISIISLASVQNAVLKFKLARKNIDSILPFINGNQHKTFLHDAYEVLIASHIGEGNYKEALKYTNLNMTMDKESFGEQSEKKLEEIEMAFKLKEKNAQIEQQQKQLEFSKANSKKQIIIITTLLILLVLLFGFVFYFKRYHIAKQNVIEASAFINGQEEERRRIASDLHDGICQELTIIKMDLKHKELTSERGALQQKLIATIDRAIKNVRDISHNLMPSVLLELGLIEALDTLVHEVNLSKTIKATYHHEGIEQERDLKLDVLTKTHIYRIIQELLNNTFKHANASNIELTLSLLSNSFRILYTDNGIGMRDTTIGNGIRNIRLRLTVINSTMSVLSNKPNGIKVNIDIPLQTIN